MRIKQYSLCVAYIYTQYKILSKIKRLYKSSIQKIIKETFVKFKNVN